MYTKLGLAAVAAICFSGAAVAADMPAKAPPRLTTVTPVSSWEGIYVGAHGGYGRGNVDVTLLGVAGSGSPDGGFGGFQVGYNYLISPNWMVGFEADVSFGNIKDSTPPLPTSTFKLDTFGTARGRLGYVTGPWLLYATAGTAWARPNWRIPGILENDRAMIGWTGGVGVEYALSSHWSTKLEYLYADFGDTSRTIPLFGPARDTALTMNMVRLGLNYRFGGIESAQRGSVMPVKAPPPAVFTWTGPYIGLHGGYAAGNFDSDISVFAAANADPAGGFAGFQGGYNWQFAPNWVIGLESDSSWGSIKDSTATANVKIDMMGSARGRFGYALNNVLFYGTGGVAWAHVKSNNFGTGNNSDAYALGWTAGGGIEYALNSRWSAKVEYAYTDFGNDTESFPGGFRYTEKIDVHTFKVGLNYHASLFGLLFNR